MTKSLRGREDAAPFFGSKTLNLCAGKSAEPQPKVARVRHPRKGYIDGVVGGQRVLIAEPPIVEHEKGIEIRIRVALASIGVMVMKHHVDNRGQAPCEKCGHRDAKSHGARTGLGLGVSDLICVVPPMGRFLGIEVKRPGYAPSRVRPEQTKWLAIVQRFGGITGIATSVEEALALVELARGVA